MYTDVLQVTRAAVEEVCLPLLTTVRLEHHQRHPVFFRVNDYCAHLLSCYRLEEGEVGNTFSIAELRTLLDYVCIEVSHHHASLLKSVGLAGRAPFVLPDPRRWRDG